MINMDILDNGKITRKMEEVPIFIQMDKDMKVIG